MAEQLALAPAVRAVGLEQVIFLRRRQDLAALVSRGPERPVVYLQSATMRTGETFDADRMRRRVRGVRGVFGQRDAYILVGFGIRGATELTALSTTSADGAAIGTAMVEAAGAGAEGVTRFLAGLGPALLRRPSGRAAGS
jgi:tryptophan synthase alpha subunit